MKLYIYVTCAGFEPALEPLETICPFKVFDLLLQSQYTDEREKYDMSQKMWNQATLLV